MSESKKVLVRLPEDVYRRLKAEASELRVSMNDVVAEALCMRLKARRASVAAWLEQLGYDGGWHADPDAATLEARVTALEEQQKHDYDEMTWVRRQLAELRQAAGLD